MHQQADNQTGTCLPVSYGYDQKNFATHTNKRATYPRKSTTYARYAFKLLKRLFISRKFVLDNMWHIHTN